MEEMIQLYGKDIQGSWFLVQQTNNEQVNGLTLGHIHQYPEVPPLFKNDQESCESFCRFQ